MTVDNLKKTFIVATSKFKVHVHWKRSHFNFQLNMSQLLWCNMMAAEGLVTHNEQTDLSRFWVKGHESRSTLRDIVDWHYQFLSMRRFIPEICGVECWTREKVVKNLMFFAPQMWGKPQIFFAGGGAFVNRHHFRPTDQVWLRSHGWSFIYADEMKKISGEI